MERRNDKRVSTLVPVENRLGGATKLSPYGRLDPEVPFIVASVFDPSQIVAADRIAWYREEYTATTGALNPWINKWGAGLNLSNATPANRPLIVDPDPLFNNLPAYDGDGATDVLTPPAGTEASWRPGSDGTGVTIWGVFRSDSATANQILWTTMTLSAANTGTTFRYHGVNQTLEYSVGNSSGTFVIQATTALSIVPPNVVHYYVIQYKEGLSNEFEVWIDGVLRLSGTTALVPAAGNPSSRLFVWRNVAATQFFNGKQAELGWTKATGIVAGLNSYLTARYAL